MRSIKVFAGLAGVLFAVLQSSQLDASLIRSIGPGDTITVRHSGFNYRQGNGGEFQLGKVNAPANARFFHTFCAETGETLGSNSQHYYVKSVGLVSKNQGGVLSAASAKLFRDYYDAMAVRNFGYESVDGSGNHIAGASTDFVLGGGVVFAMGGTAAQRAASGAAVQQALWNLLGYGNTVSGVAKTLRDHYLATYNVPAFTGEYFGVRIAHLVNPNNHEQRFQDQFVVIPEPGSMLVWGLMSLAAVGVAVRRRRS